MVIPSLNLVTIEQSGHRYMYLADNAWKETLNFRLRDLTVNRDYVYRDNHRISSMVSKDTWTTDRPTSSARGHQYHRECFERNVLVSSYWIKNDQNFSHTFYFLILILSFSYQRGQNEKNSAQPFHFLIIIDLNIFCLSFQGSLSCNRVGYTWDSALSICYKVHSVKQDYHGARSRCSSEHPGSRLLLVDSLAIYNFLLNLIGMLSSKYPEFNLPIIHPPCCEIERKKYLKILACEKINPDFQKKLIHYIIIQERDLSIM